MSSENDLYTRFLEGEEYLFDVIVLTYRKQLTGYLFSITKDIHISEEIAEDVFVKLWFRKPIRKEPSSLKTFLYTIGRNMAIDHLRKQKRVLETDFDSQIDAISCINPLEAVEFDEKKAEINRALQKLNKDYAEVLVLTSEGFSQDEISKIMKKKKKSVYDLLYRARKSLRDEIARESNENR